MGGGIERRVGSEELPQRRIGQPKDACLPGIPVAGIKNSLSLPGQGCENNRITPPLICSLNGGVDPPQVHVRGQKKGRALIKGVAPREVLRRWDEFRLYGKARQTPSVVRSCHDGKLQGAGSVTGDEMGVHTQPLVRLTVADQAVAGAVLSVLQLRKDLSVACAGKEKRLASCLQLGCVPRKSSQFVRKEQFAVVGTNVVDRVDTSLHAGHSCDTGIGPGIGSAAAGVGRKKDPGSLPQGINARCEHIGTGAVKGEQQAGNIESPLNVGIPV